MSDAGPPDANTPDGAAASDGGLPPDAAPPVDAALPTDAAPPIDAPMTDAGECTATSMCTGTRPICNTGTALCRACASGTECAAKNSGAPYCDTSGACVACRTSADCASTNGVCDSGSKTCRMCRADAECDSGICNESTGMCDLEAVILYVGPTGTDFAGCGARSSKCRTIAMGLTQLGSKRRMHLETSTYPEAVNISISGAGLLIAGNNSTIAPSVSFPERPAVTVTENSDVTLDRVNIMGARGFTNGDGVRCDGGTAGATLQLVNVYTLMNEADGVKGTNCTVTVLGGGTGDNRGTGLSARFSNVVIRQSSIAGNYRGVVVDASPLVLERSEVSGNALGGLLILASDFTVRNNVFSNNGGDSNSGAGSITVSGAPPGGSATLSFNTIVGGSYGQSQPSVGGITCLNLTSTLTFSNNILFNAGDEVSGNCGLTYSNVQGGASGTGNINADPMFVGGASANYHILPGSPCKDRGLGTGAPTVDFDGEPRPFPGTAVDIGYDEVQQ